MKKGLLLVLIFFLGCSQIIWAQTRKISGNVTSTEDGMPIPGVSVSIKGTTLGTVTNIDGNYELIISQDSKVLVFSFVGMKTQETPITGALVYNAKLAPDVVGVDEVVIVAFGTAKKGSITGATSVIKGDEIAKIQTSNVTRTLEGATAGVQITSNKGLPGADAKIRIRGIGSINADSSPLIVLDGVPYDGSLNSINTNDIESMNVLKDAASNSLYGSRGANGVILINTKKGKEGKTTVNFSAKAGINSRSIPEYDIMTDPKMYYETYWEALRNSQTYAGKSASEASTYASQTLISDLIYNCYDVADDKLVGTDGKFNSSAKLKYHDDWGNEMFRNDYRQEYNLSLSSGSKTTTTFLSLGYLEDNGYTVNANFQRMSGRLNVDHNVTDWLKVGVNTSVVMSEHNYPDPNETAGVNMFYVSRLMAPIYPIYKRDANGQKMYDADGNVIHDYGDDPSRPFNGLANPLGSQTYDTDQYLRNVYTNNIYADIKFLKDFTFRSSVNSTIQFTENNVYLNGKYGQYQNNNGISAKYERKINSFNAQQLLTWKKEMGLHEMEVLVGHESYHYKYNYLYAQKEYFLLDTNHEMSGAIRNPQSDSYQRDYYTEGYLSRVTYNYNDRYYLSASYRRDASSKFHPDHRWGNFWSVGASWRLSEESFMQNYTWLDDLKFKVSYGTQGNDAILDPQGYYNYQPYLDQYTVGNTNNQPSLVQSYKGNVNLTWEKSKTFNTGFDYSMLEGRIDGTIEFFSRTASDLLFNRPLPPSTGDRTYPDNIGDMNNKGIELLINTDIIRKKDFNWSISLNATHYKNKITKLPPENIEKGVTRGNYKLTIGGSIYDYYLPKYAGVEETTGKSMWYKDVKDANGNVTETTTTTTFNDATYYILNSAIPKLYGGFSTDVKFKGFDFSAKFSYQLGGKVYDAIYANLMQGGAETGQNFHKDILNRWTESNKKSNIPALNTDDSFINNGSDRWLVNASFISLSNLTFGYSLPKNLIERIDLSTARIYVVADNVAFLSKRKGLDPRMNFNGDVEFFASPIRTVSIGIDLKF